MARKQNLPRGVSYSEKEKRYTGRFMVDGVRYTVHDTKLQKVQDKMDALRYEVKHGVYCKPQNETVSSWFEKWMDEYKSNTLKKGSIQTYQQAYRCYIEKELGRYKLSDVSAQAIQRLINNMYKKGYSKTRTNIAKVILTGMFDQAKKNKLIAINPAESITLPRFRKKRQDDVRVMTPEEQALFLQYAEQSLYYDYYVASLATGMRIGEVLALDWSDIDFLHDEIHVTGTLIYERGGTRYKDTPKTETSLRTIPLLPVLKTVLKARRKQQMELRQLLSNQWQSSPGRETAVFTYDDGGNFWDTAIRVNMKKIVAQINADGIEFEPITPKTFRHTFATRCAENGMPLQVLKTIMGHSSLAMTSDLYSHVLGDQKKEEMQKIANLF